MKRIQILLLCAAAVGGVAACKSSDPYPEFGIPEEEPKFMSREWRDEKSDKWHERRIESAKREDEKWDRIFDRTMGNY